jgi:hypothetical protein
MRLKIVLLVSVERLCVGPISDNVSVSLKFADVWTTAIPELIAESKAAESTRIVEGTGGVAVIAALRAFT